MIKQKLINNWHKVIFLENYLTFDNLFLHFVFGLLFIKYIKIMIKNIKIYRMQR